MKMSNRRWGGLFINHLPQTSAESRSLQVLNPRMRSPVDSPNQHVRALGAKKEELQTHRGLADEDGPSRATRFQYPPEDHIVPQNHWVVPENRRNQG